MMRPSESESATGGVPSAVTQRAERLGYEWRRAQREFAYHPFVRIVPLDGDPPTSFEVHYRVRTLVVDEGGTLVYADACSVTIELGDTFPQEPPVVRPMQGVFHPNVDGASVHLVPAWHEMNSLVEAIQRVGQMLAFQSYDPKAVANPAAHAWVVTNASYIPTDAGANFSTDTGGKPIVRIGRSGAATLAALREQLLEFCRSLLEEGVAAPAPEDVVTVAERTRMAAELFLPADVPEELTDEAQPIVDAARALPGLLHLFQRRRGMMTHVASAGAAVAELHRAGHELEARLAALEAMVTHEPSEEPAEALLQLPATAALQEALGTLRVTLTATERAYVAALGWVRLLSPPDVKTVPALLAEVLPGADEQELAASMTVDNINTALASVEENIGRARKELGTIERLTSWREYLDLARQSMRRARQITAWGPAGVHAYMMVNDAGTHGPFDFEQEISFAGMQVALRSTDREAVELIDIKNGRVLAKSADAKSHDDLRVRLPGEQPGESVKAAFRRTPSCEALSVQLGYAKRNAEALLGKVGAAGRPPLPPSWTGAFLDRLSSPEFYRRSIDQQATASHEWALLSADLNALAPFKERIATYHLLVRVGEALPVHLSDKQEAERAIAAANVKIREIMARGTLDPETGQTIIPARLLPEYESLVERVSKHEHRVARLDQAIALAASHVRHRVTSSERFGSAEVPQLTSLGEVPQEWAGYPAAMADLILLEMVRGIEDLLGERFLARKPGATAAQPAAAPLPPLPPPAVEETPEILTDPPAAAAEDAEIRHSDDVIEGWPS